MYESNYQQLSHTFVDFCSSQEQTLTLHQFLEQLYPTKKMCKHAIKKVSGSGCRYVTLIKMKSAADIFQGFF